MHPALPPRRGIVEVVTIVDIVVQLHVWPALPPPGGIYCNGGYSLPFSEKSIFAPPPQAGLWRYLWNLLFASPWLATLAFSSLFRVFSQILVALQGRCAGGSFKETRLRFKVSFVEPRFPRMVHIPSHAAHQGGLVIYSMVLGNPRRSRTLDLGMQGQGVAYNLHGK